MATKKQCTARASANRLQRRFREPYTPSRVEDIHAEHVSEDELVEMVKYAKAELLKRYKKWGQKRTENNILAIRDFFDIGKEVSQWDNLADILIQHMEVMLEVLGNEFSHSDRRKKVKEEASLTICLAKKFRQERKK